MKAMLSRLPVVIPAFAMVLIGVASVAFAWGSSSAGHPAGPAAMQSAPPANAPSSNVSSSNAPPAGATGNPGGLRNPANPRFGPAGGTPVFGTVASKTDTTIVVTTVGGTKVTVNVSATTTYSVRGVAVATLADVAVGDRIVAQGTTNADGSVNATIVATGVFRVPGSGGDDGGRGGFPGQSAPPQGIGA
ncbi:MAG TPA: hypothetical protein VF371_10635 [Candidatus Limnocylindrales bacterium]